MATVRGRAFLTSCMAFASAVVPPPLPPAAMPPPRSMLPAWSAQASAAALAPAAAAQAAALAPAAAARARAPIPFSNAHPGMDRRSGMPVRTVSMDASETEAKLKKILSDTNETAAHLYSEADILRLPRLANGEPSVALLVAHLEATKPPPAPFDKNELVGEWQLEYTNDLPVEVRLEVELSAYHLLQDMSVVLTISDKGAMNVKTVISSRGAENKIFNAGSSIAQIESSPSFTVTDPDGKIMFAHITYSGDELLVLRKEDHIDEWIDELFVSMGVSPAMPRIEVWKRTSGQAAETPSTASPVSLWRFGLPASVLDTDVTSPSSSPTVEPSRNPSLFTWLLVAVFLVSSMFFSVVFYVVRKLSPKPKQPSVASTELASYGESNSAYSASMDEEQQWQTPSPADNSSSWFSLRAVFLSALAALSLTFYEPSAHAASSGGRMGGSARAARTRSPPPRASPQLRSKTTVIERNHTTIIAPPPVGFSPGLGMGGPVIVAPAPTLGDIVVGAAVDGAVRGAVSGAIGGPHYGPSSTDRMLENQQRQDERQIDKQAAEIEALKKELDQLKAEKK